jgi:nitroimidazol reductase NimA-like FMN-containing flavoprotein (pyridoxamine 5'-phosphate oxidase superfamily)
MTTATIKGPWPEEKIRQFLQESTFPVRLGCNANDGHPRVVSLWYRYDAGRLLCVTHQESQVARLLQADNRVGFEISPNDPPYLGVRGQGLAELEPLGQSSTLEDLLQRYLGGQDSSLAQWLLDRSDEELLIAIEPQRLFCWDYSERMTGISP